MTAVFVVIGCWFALNALLVALRWRAVKARDKQAIARRIAPRAA